MGMVWYDVNDIHLNSNYDGIAHFARRKGYLCSSCVFHVVHQICRIHKASPEVVSALKELTIADLTYVKVGTFY